MCFFDPKIWIFCNSSRLYNGHLEEEMVCAKANGDSPICHEDMGAPLMCLEGSTWQLQGVLSKRGGCRGDGPRPAVLTSISNLKGWILDTIGEMRKYSITFSLTLLFRCCLKPRDIQGIHRLTVRRNISSTSINSYMLF